MTIAEIAIAARMNGMTYGKYTYLLRLGMVKLPSIEEIRGQMVKKKDGNAARRVVQYDKKGEYVATYESAAEAAAAIDEGRCRACAIYNACTGKTNSAYGYQWRYEGDKAPGVYMNRGTMPIRKTKLVDRVCVLCGAEYKGVGRSRYCSKECADVAKAENGKRYYEKHKHYPEERQVVCKHCGKQFNTVHGRAVFCSERCRNASTMAAYRERKLAQNRKAGA